MINKRIYKGHSQGRYESREDYLIRRNPHLKHKRGHVHTQPTDSCLAWIKVCTKQGPDCEGLFICSMVTTVCLTCRPLTKVEYRNAWRAAKRLVDPAYDHNNLSKRSRASTITRKIWINAYGPTPPWHDIHHINRNPYDNRLENLMCLFIEDHYLVHAMAGDIGAKFFRPRLERYWSNTCQN